MKFVSDRPFAGPDAAARKLMQLGQRRRAGAGRPHLYRKINWAFLIWPAIRATPSEYKAGLDLATAKGWLWLHESGTYVKLTEASEQTATW